MSYNSIKFALFWGCMIPLRLPWIEVAARKVLPKLGIEILDLPFSCCPDPIASKSLDHMTWLSLAARNLTLAEEQNLDIMVLCSGCFETLRLSKHELENKAIREKVNGILSSTGHEYHGTTNVFHIQQWLYDEMDLDYLKKSIINPLSFRVATHTGCHFIRPADILRTDDPVYPEKLDILCDILGLEVLEYPDKNLCCGAGVGFVDRQVSQNLIERKIAGSKKTGAEAIIAFCPSCIQSYDMGQKFLKKENQQSIKMIPVFHILEVLGLALGMDRDEFALDKHHVPVTLKL
jgi:heterodisulfide reductase subunit B